MPYNALCKFAGSIAATAIFVFGLILFAFDESARNWLTRTILSGGGWMKIQDK